MESYLIKQVEPLHQRRRVYHRFSRPRLWSVDEKAGTLVSLSSANNNSSVTTVVAATHRQASGGGPTALGFVDDETTTDWQPEIPFENVRVHTTGCFFCRPTGPKKHGSDIQTQPQTLPHKRGPTNCTGTNFISELAECSNPLSTPPLWSGIPPWILKLLFI